MPSDGRQGPDYRSNLHVPGMDSVPDTEVFESPEQSTDKSFSTFGKETPLSHQHQQLHHQYHHHHHHLSHLHHHHHSSLERKELEAFLPSSKAPCNPAYLSEYCIFYLAQARPARPPLSDVLIELGEGEGKRIQIQFSPQIGEQKEA